MIIENEHSSITLLVGAGASVHLGLPTLDDLLKRAVLGNDEVAERIRQTRNSIEAAPKRYKTAVFEELIVQIKDYLRMTHVMKIDNTYRREINSIPYDFDNGQIESKWKKALSKCYRVLLDEYGPSKIDPSSESFFVTIELLKKISELNGNSLQIFTTNYDCSYQVLGSNTDELNVFSHIDNKNGRFKDNWFPQERDLEEDIPSVFIHRLHGCVAWYVMSGGGDCFKEDCGVVEEVWGAGDDLIIEDDDYLNNMCIKLIASQLLGTNPVFSSSFEEFEAHLENTQILLVWGYSFRDLEVLRQINHICATSKNHFRIFYLDPYLSENRVVNNIRNTFHSAPIPISPRFKPKQIDWKPLHGYQRMIDMVITTLESELKT